jgi:hypothetical protein
MNTNRMMRRKTAKHTSIDEKRTMYGMFDEIAGVD